MKVDLPNFHLPKPIVTALFTLFSALLILIISGFILSQKEVVIDLDGKIDKVITRSSTVSQLLAEKNIKLSSHDDLSPSGRTALVPNGKVTIRRARLVTIDINGKKRRVWTTGRTVKAVVEGLGIDTNADIKLSPAPQERVAADMNIRIQLLNRWIEKIQTDVAFNVKRQDDAGLRKGRTQVAVKGKPGTKETVIEHVMAGGKEVEKIVRSETIIAAPVDELVKVGTMVPRQSVAGVGPGINVARGGRSLTMLATAYAAGGGAGWRTATGTGVYKGIVAVDPRVIPLGTRLYIDGYGPAVAADTGGAIKGNRIDLAFGSVGEAIQFGRRSVTVHILN